MRGAPLMTPEDGSKLYRWWFLFNFRWFVSFVTCTTRQRLRGFEPVRKGNCSADARPVLFSKRITEWKLTGADYWWNLLLLVIFGWWERQIFNHYHKAWLNFKVFICIMQAFVWKSRHSYKVFLNQSYLFFSNSYFSNPKPPIFFQSYSFYQNHCSTNCKNKFPQTKDNVQFPFSKPSAAASPHKLSDFYKTGACVWWKSAARTGSKPLSRRFVVQVTYSPNRRKLNKHPPQ